MLANKRPLGGPRNHQQRDASSVQILLIADAPVGRQEQVEARLLGSG
jgi:hypothetical protein